MDIYEEITAAAERIRPHILRTPLIPSPHLSSLSGGEVFLKLESEQYTGSFKARGSLNKLLWLQEQGTEFYPVTASTGNHGLGFARALDLLGIEGRVYLPENAAATKVDRIRSYGADITFYSDDPYETEMHAKALAGEREGWVYISPYNDPQVIGGQGTVAAEILDLLPSPGHLLATVGGGGLISGLAAYLKRHSPGTEIVGCQPGHSHEMAASVQAGEYREITSKPTLSDGSAGGFERDSITFDLCRRWIDRFILTGEQEIEEGIRLMIDRHSKMVEGSAGVAVASFLQQPERFRNASVVIVICGANISRSTLKSLL